MTSPILFVAAVLTFSPALWGRGAPDPLAWSFVEIGGALLLLRRWKRGALFLPDRPPFLTGLLFVLWSALSLLWTSNLHATLTALYSLIACGFFWIAFLNEEEPQTFHRAIRWVGTLGMILWLATPPFRNGWVRDPNLFGGFLALSALECMSRAADAEKGGFFLWGASALGHVSVLLALGSLSPLLGWACGACLLFRSPSRPANRLKLVPLLALAGILTLLSLLPFPRNPLNHLWYRKRTDLHVSERLQIWKDGFLYFRRHWVRGTGLGTFEGHYPEFKGLPGLRIALHAHNEWLHLACEGGIVALALALGLGIFIVRSPPDRGGGPLPMALAGIVQILVQSLFDFNLHSAPIAAALAFYAALRSGGKRRLDWGKFSRGAMAAGVSLLGLLFLLPGAAFGIFRLGKAGLLAPEKTAVWAQSLDPLNAVYYSETRQLSRLRIAIELNPRNVWYRLRAARFYAGQWEATRSPELLASALEEYRILLSLAPGVREFEEENRRFVEEARARLRGGSVGRPKRH